MTITNHENEFKQAIREAGIDFDPSIPIIADEQIHRFNTRKSNKNKKDGWYVFFGNAGAFGDWSANVSGKWSAQREGLSKAEISRLDNSIKKAKTSQVEEIKRKQNEASVLAESIWQSALDKLCSGGYKYPIE